MNWRHPETLQGETNQLQTSGEPDTTSQTGRQRNCCKGKQMESQTPPANLGDKWIVSKGETNDFKWIWRHPESRRAGHNQQQWETNELLKAETNQLETSGEPDATSQTGRQMNCNKWRQKNWRLETSREPDTTSQTGRQTSCYKARQMNWRHPEGRTPPARLGDKWIAVKGDKCIGDIRRAGNTQPHCMANKWIAVRENKWIGNLRGARHHQSQWETHEML